MLRTEPDLFQCFFCDCTTKHASKLTIHLPSGKLICSDCKGL